MLRCTVRAKFRDHDRLRMTARQRKTSCP
jgi:hypothetical protein